MEIDVDGSGTLDINEVRPMVQAIVQSFSDTELNEEQQEVLVNRMFEWLDVDNSGLITFHEFKVMMMRAFKNRVLPEELV